MSAAKNASVISNTPTATGDYQICGYVNVKTVSGGNVALVVTYLDENNNSVTDKVPLMLKASATTSTAATTASNYKGLAFGVRASGAHAIAVVATTSAGATITFDAGAWLTGIS